MNKLTVITHIYNEEKMIPYFLRHYHIMGADRIVVFVDKQTNDESVNEMKKFQLQIHKNIINVRESPITEGLDDIGLVQWASEAYHEFAGKSEWCIWPDCDELIYFKGGLLPRLDWHKTQGHQLIRMPRMWRMVTNKFPTTTGQIYDEVKKGIYFDDVPWGLGKPIIFQPTADIIWNPGKHNCAKAPMIHINSEMLFLHFRMLGLDYHLERNHVNWARTNEYNKRKGHNWHTNPDNDEQQTKGFNDDLNKAVEVPL